LFLPLIVWGQEGDKKILIGINSGISIPTGKFASKQLFDEKAGFAEEGYHFGIDAIFILDKHFGVCGSIKAGSNPLDVQGIANGFAATYGGTFTVSAQRWNHAGVYIGALVTVPIKKLSIDFRIMPGMVNFFYPRVTAESSQYIYTLESLPSRVIGFLAGGSIRYPLSKKFSTAVNFETMRSKNAFELVSDVNGNTNTSTFDQPISIYFIGLNLSYKLYSEQD
jgi:hypothetical protein